MISNLSKIQLIIERLLEKTKSSSVRWSNAGQSNAYVARLDDYAFQLSGPAQNDVLSAALTSISLEIKRTDGSIVSRVSTENGPVNALAEPADDNVILPSYQSQSLRQLYRQVASRESDYDAILAALD